ncbi:cartilage-associated protein-like isoform X5 [Toxorhynchites rutilus septentrionalis]|uniref:cartilage-associated protein-like isoform X5 n=1 Tax=Toxorhynchites rutilus septentrionalis TaxID=329112 RepID=UPI002479DCC0|nr:cartilage-associated protein-like isoform X5 [Toxorhynchites rutilus septentrionalis]
MNMLAVYVVILLVLQDQLITSESMDPNDHSSSKSFIEFYDQGVQSYLSGEYDDCVYLLEMALDKYRNYYESISNCRIECEYENRDIKNKGDFLYSNDIEDLRFYELILKRTLCLAKCRRRNIKYFPFEEDFDGYLMELFKTGYAYSYLYACYTKTNQPTLAASAALTYLVKNPADDLMKKNFALAMEKTGVDADEVVDLEEKKFVKLFVLGILAINAKEWQKVITLLESSIMQFIFDENQCRAFCEGEFDHGFIPDFISSIGNINSGQRASNQLERDDLPPRILTNDNTGLMMLCQSITIHKMVEGKYCLTRIVAQTLPHLSTNYFDRCTRAHFISEKHTYIETITRTNASYEIKS